MAHPVASGSPSGSPQRFVELPITTTTYKPLDAPRGPRRELSQGSATSSPTPEPPVRPPPAQKAGGFGGRGALNINPLRALSPMVQLIRRTSASSVTNVPQTPRGPPASSASDSQLPSVKPPPTPPRSSSRRPTPRKPATPQREGSPQLPVVQTPTPPPQKTGGTPRSSTNDERDASPVPNRPRNIRPPASAVSCSAPAAPGHPPGGAHSNAADKYSTQCREMMQVQNHANKLLGIVFDFTVTEEAAVSILDQYPELAWLAHCLQRCPMPPCWTSVDVEQDEARYVDMESGDMTDTPPLMKQFAEMATLMLQWRQCPTSAGDVGKELGAIHANAVEDAARARRVWSGPHVDNETSAKFWHCEATGRSTWGDPSAAAEFLARVAERLKRALPVPLESEEAASSSPAAAPSTKVAESVVAIAEAAAAAEARCAPERSDSPKDAADTPAVADTPTVAATPAAAATPATTETPAAPDTPAVANAPSGDFASTAQAEKKLGGTGELISARTAEVRKMMAKISAESKVKELPESARRKDSPKPGKYSPKPGKDSPKPGKDSPKPGKSSPAPSPTPRAPSPCTGHPRPSPRTPRRGVAQLVAQEASNSNFGGLGNKVYLEAAAEVRGPKAGVWRPGASRPNLSARRRPEKTESLEPLNGSHASSQAKRVTILEKDGVTAVRPGRDTPEGAVSPSPDLVNDNVAAMAPTSRPPSARRAGTPVSRGSARPKTRRGDDEIHRPWTPCAHGELPEEDKPQPVRPGSALGGTHGTEQLMAQEDAVVTASPRRSGRLPPGASLSATAEEFLKDTDSEAECVEMEANSPLGNTGCARLLCDVAIAAAVDAATAAASDELGETQQFMDTQPLSPMKSMRMSKVLGAEVMTFDAPGDDAEAENSSEAAPEEAEAPKEVTMRGAMVSSAEAKDAVEPAADPLAEGATTGEPVVAGEAAEVLNNTQLSATLISIAGPCSPSSAKKDPDSSYADSPSLVILEDPRFTPCKTLPRPASPEMHADMAEPQTPKRAPRSGRLSSRGRAEDRPIRCKDPEPLSARGRERLENERRELFQACWQNAQAAADDTAAQAHAAAPLNAPRGPRPNARGVRHVAKGGA